MEKKAKKKLPQKHFVSMNHIRWRKERGIKLVMSIMPVKSGIRATCVFESKTYIGNGKTHTEALDNCMKIIKEQANLD